jgi:DNA-binding MarR family transcriptional regulator
VPTGVVDAAEVHMAWQTPGLSCSMNSGSRLTILHVAAYYSRVPEVSTHDDSRLTATAIDLMQIFQGMPRQVPPPPARDLTMGQIRLLFMLRHAGPLPMGRIAEVFDLSSTAATGFVGRIERHGLVERRHRSDDRRVVECALTDAGTQFLDALFGVRLEAVRSALSVLSPRQLSGFQRLVGHIRDRQELPGHQGHQP